MPKDSRPGRKFCKPSCRTLAFRARQQTREEPIEEPHADAGTASPSAADAGSHSSPAQARWKHALAPFAEPVVRGMAELHQKTHGEQALSTELYVNGLMPFMLLLTQAEVAALLSATSSQPPPSPQALVEQIKASIQTAPEFYRASVAQFAASNEAPLIAAAAVVQREVKQRLREALGLAPMDTQQSPAGS